jgi:hypothetical protein
LSSSPSSRSWPHYRCSSWPAGDKQNASNKMSSPLPGFEGRNDGRRFARGLARSIAPVLGEVRQGTGDLKSCCLAIVLSAVCFSAATSSLQRLVKAHLNSASLNRRRRY